MVHVREKHWADEIADEILKQGRGPHEISTGISPSGEIHIGNLRIEQTISLGANLMRGAVIDPQGARTPPNVDAKSLPREGLLKDALPQITREKEGVGPSSAQRCKELEMGGTDVLRLINDREVEHHIPVLRNRGRKGCKHFRVGDELPRE